VRLDLGLGKSASVDLTISLYDKVLFANHPPLQVVPSAKAWGGAYSNNKRVKVSIQGTCKPQQWVPMKYCLSQFIKTCAKGARAGTYGRGEMRFGNGGCQRFMITSNG
jgi:hypothetical protein